MHCNRQCREGVRTQLSSAKPEVRKIGENREQCGSSRKVIFGLENIVIFDIVFFMLTRNGL